MVEERRHFGRIPFGIEVALDIPDSTCPGVLLDISLKGALLELPSQTNEIRKGQSGHLKLQLVDEATLEFTVEAIHIDGRQLGVKFTEFDLDTLSHLRRLLELNSGDPDRVKNELHFLVGPD